MRIIDCRLCITDATTVTSMVVVYGVSLHHKTEVKTRMDSRALVPGQQKIQSSCYRHSSALATLNSPLTGELKEDRHKLAWTRRKWTSSIGVLHVLVLSIVIQTKYCTASNLSSSGLSNQTTSVDIQNVL